jgi:hypothetical protein
MTAADGTVLALDVATSPAIAAYGLLQPVTPSEKAAEDVVERSEGCGLDQDTDPIANEE